MVWMPAGRIQPRPPHQDRLENCLDPGVGRVHLYRARQKRMDACTMAIGVNSRPPVTILSVSAAPKDHTALRRLLRGLCCRVAAAGTCRSALRRLRHGRITIVVCESSLPDGTWRDILNHLGGVERPVLIVTSKLADEALWAEVLNLGGFDVIPKPFNPREARHVLQTACLRPKTGTPLGSAPGRILAADRS